VVEAAPLERVVDLPGAVRGEDDDRRRGWADRADLREGHLEIGEDLQEEGLERLVGAVELVDQQHGGTAARLVGLQGQEERAFQQEAFGEDVVGEPGPPLGPRLAAQLRQADLEHLAG